MKEETKFCWQCENCILKEEWDSHSRGFFHFCKVLGVFVNKNDVACDKFEEK